MCFVFSYFKIGGMINFQIANQMSLQELLKIINNAINKVIN